MHKNWDSERTKCSFQGKLRDCDIFTSWDQEGGRVGAEGLGGIICKARVLFFKESRPLLKWTDNSSLCSINVGDFLD